MYTNRRCTWQEMFLHLCAFLSSVIVRVVIPGVQEVLGGGLCLEHLCHSLLNKRDRDVYK